MYRSNRFMTILSYLGLVLVIALTGYWLLMIIAPPPAGWSDEGTWIAVSELMAQPEAASESKGNGKTNESQAARGGTTDEPNASHTGQANESRDSNSGQGSGSNAGQHDANRTQAENPASDDSLIPLNKADAEQLQRLPGIGPAKARAIIEYRREHGAFESLEELLNVKGIGEKTLANILPYLKLD
jgi:competence protein ComEA